MCSLQKCIPMTTRPAWDVCLWTLLKRKRLLNWEHSKKGNDVGRSQNYSRISKKDSNVVNLVNPTSPQKRQNVLWQTMAMYGSLFHHSRMKPRVFRPPPCHHTVCQHHGPPVGSVPQGMPRQELRKSFVELGPFQFDISLISGKKWRRPVSNGSRNPSVEV